MRYEYKCSSCEHIFEKVLPVAQMNEPKESPCPECNTKGSVERYISTPRTFNIDPNKYTGDSTFQKYVLGRIRDSVPSHLRSDNKYSVPKEY